VELDIDQRENQLSPESITGSAPSESPLPAEASSSCPDKSLQNTSPLLSLLAYPNKKENTASTQIYTGAESFAYLEEKQRKNRNKKNKK